MLLGPLYALTITTLLSIITNRVNNLLISVLYVLSFSILLVNQEYNMYSDIGGYLDLYHQTKFQTSSYLLENFIKNPNGRELLWVFYCKSLGLLTGYSTFVFLLTTYMIIFSLSAYAAFLISERGRYNFALLLFVLIFFEITFLSSGYNLWRGSISGLVLIIGVMNYFSLKSKLTSRFTIYTSAFIHLSAIPFIAFFELYVIFFNRNERYVSTNKWVVLRLVLIPIIVIFSAYYLNNIMGLIPVTEFTNALQKYNEASDTFNILSYLRPFYLLILAYIFLNRKRLSQSDLFFLLLFIIVQILLLIPSNLNILYVRMSATLNISILLIVSKVFDKFNLKYIIAFVCIIFCLRMITFANSSNMLLSENIFIIGEGLNPFSGLLLSIVYFLNPSGYGF